MQKSNYEVREMDGKYIVVHIPTNRAITLAATKKAMTFEVYEAAQEFASLQDAADRRHGKI